MEVYNFMNDGINNISSSLLETLIKSMKEMVTLEHVLSLVGLSALLILFFMIIKKVDYCLYVRRTNKVIYTFDEDDDFPA